jgi:hypothetical protein
MRSTSETPISAPGSRRAGCSLSMECPSSPSSQGHLPATPATLFYKESNTGVPLLRRHLPLPLRQDELAKAGVKKHSSHAG